MNHENDAEGITRLDCRVWSPAPKKSFVLGVHWRYAESAGDAKDTLKAWKKGGFASKDAKLRVIPSGDGNWIVGAWTGRAQYLAAPLMASVIRSGIFVQHLGGDEAWMLAASDGCVLPGHDLIVSVDRISDLLREWCPLLPDPSVYGDTSGAQRTSEECWKTLLEGIKNKEIDADIIKASSLTSLGTGASILVAVALGAAVLTAAVLVVLPLLRGPDAPPMVNMGALNAARQAQEHAARQATLRARFEQEVATIRQRYASPFGAQEAFEVIDLLRAMPFERGGARLLELGCERAATEPQRATWTCTPIWRNDTFAGFLHQAPLRPTVPGLDGNTGAGFAGTAFNLSIERQAQNFVALHPSDWWLHEVHDSLLATGMHVTMGAAAGAGVAAGVGAGAAGGQGWGQPTQSQSAVAISNPDPIMVLAGAFQVDGFALENTPDARVGDRVMLRWTTSLAQLQEPGWREFWRQWPAQVQRIHIGESGAVTIELSFARLVAQP